MATLYITNRNGNMFSDNFYEGGVPSFNEATKNRLEKIDKEIKDLQKQYEEKEFEINSLKKNMNPLISMRQNERFPRQQENEADRILNNYNNTDNRLLSELKIIDEKMNALKKKSNEIEEKAELQEELRELQANQQKQDIQELQPNNQKLEQSQAIQRLLPTQQKQPGQPTGSIVVPGPGNLAAINRAIKTPIQFNPVDEVGDIESLSDIDSLSDEDLDKIIHEAYGIELCVPMLLEAKIGNNWLDTKDVM